MPRPAAATTATSRSEPCGPPLPAGSGGPHERLRRPARRNCVPLLCPTKAGRLVRRLGGKWVFAAIRPAGKPAGLWALPKGRVDPGERTQETALREVTEETANRINSAKRVIAVGTTCVRVLESIVRDDKTVPAEKGATDIFIRAPFTFQRVGAMLTNFHLPRSTLLVLVSAFAGRELILRAYSEAVRERYRFFSYGDCMLIL